MGLSEAWARLREGKPGDSFSYLWISDDDIRRDREVESKLRDLNQKAFEQGRYDGSELALANKQLEESKTDFYLTEEAYSPYGGAKQSLRENVPKIPQTLSALVPWYVWLGVGLFAAAWVYSNFFRRP